MNANPRFGVVFHSAPDWKGTSGRTEALVWTGILPPAASTTIIGNPLGSH